MHEKRAQDIRRAAAIAWERQADLHDLFDGPDSIDFRCWLETEGWRADPRVRELSPPLPPSEIYRYSNTSDDWGYLFTAAATYRGVMEVARDLGLGPGEIRRVLDFGCGPGRGLRLFHAHADLLELHGTDVDETAISWCRRNLDFAEFHLNAEEPPLDFSDSSFDLVFSISVFSHFSAPTAAAWLAELRRLIRPGGIAVLSVHGRHALERAANEAEIFAMLEIDEQALGAAREAFETDGFAFVSQPGGHLSEARYGVAFVDERHLRTTWTEVFELVEVRRAAIDDWQDLVVLRRP